MSSKSNLSEPQRRSLSVTAKRIERTTNELIELLSLTSSSTLCENITKSFSKDERTQYDKLFRELKQLNEQMFHALNLEASTIDERQILGAKLVHLWTVLEDSRSHKMKRYGELSKESAQEVDRHIQRLLDILERAIKL